MKKFKTFAWSDKNEVITKNGFVEIEASSARAAANKLIKQLDLKSGSLEVNNSRFEVSEGKIM